MADDNKVLLFQPHSFFCFFFSFSCLFIYNTYYSHATYVLHIVLIWLFLYILTHAIYVYTSHACL